MAPTLKHVYAAPPPGGPTPVLQALRSLTEEDISQKSPVTPGIPEVSFNMTREDGQRRLVLTVDSDDGEWSKTSEEAIQDAVLSTITAEELVESEGGYDG